MVANLTISDQQERIDALDGTHSWIVEAPAGSGKTGLLIQRYLKLLGTVEDPAEVLALTFTNKATAEMQHRVLEALRKAKDPTATPTKDFDRLTHTFATAALQQDERYGWRLLQRPQRLNIRTIDSLCGEIARSLPLLSGEAGLASPIPDASQLYRRAARAVMMRFGGDDAALNKAVHEVLMHRDGDLLFCERVLAEMLQTREQWGSLIPLGNALTEAHLENVTLPRLNESLQRTVCAAMETCRDSFDEAALHEIATILERLAYAPGYKGEANPYAHCMGMPVPLGCSPDHLVYWKSLAQLTLTKDGWRKSFSGNYIKAEADKRDTARLKEILEEHGTEELFELLNAVRAFDDDVRYPDDQWRIAKALFRLLERALIELRLLFAREEVCDFAEVALAARTALNENAGDVQSAIGTKLRHLLVDEMQDTSSGQYELLQTLTAGWDGSSQTVFLVGDPKQSIYLFRQARVDLFQRCMEQGRLGNNGVELGVLRLSTNFRSGGALVQSFNDTFLRIFPESNAADGDVEFHEAAASNSASPNDCMQWHGEAVPKLDDLQANRRSRRNAVRREAREVVSLIQAWYANAPIGKTPKIAVLTRARSHVTEIARHLQKNNVPYKAIDLESLAEQNEVLDILAITRALLHPADRTAWLAILHAPWCGAGIADLHTLAAGDDVKQRKQALRPTLRQRANLLSEPMAARVHRTLDVMDAALTHTGSASLSDRVERTWRSLGGDTTTTALGRENVRQFLRVLDEMEAEGETATEPTLRRRLERLFAQPSHVPNAVDVMTIHRAKGLEWDLVLLPGLHRLSGRNAYTALEWLELPTSSPIDGSTDVLLAPLPGKGGEAGALLQFIRTRRRNREYLELKRLFYVAVTRARTALHLFASPEARTDGTPITLKGTLLKAAWNAAQDEVHPAPTAQTLAPPDAFTEEFLDEPNEPIALAAAAEVIVMPSPRRAQPKLARLPLTYDAIAHLHRHPPLPRADLKPAAAPFVRPEGTFGARAVGNAIHAFVERLANQLGRRTNEGATVPQAARQLDADLVQWNAAIRTTLRAGGLPADEVERATLTVQTALHNLLSSDEGLWLLMPHHQAASEASWRAGASDDITRVRLDRTFFAGNVPNAPGSDTLWIVDFKTGNHKTDQEAYLAEERTNYAPQLNTYAALRLQALPPETPVMLALSYPLMGRLIYWPYESSATNAPQLTPTALTEEPATKEDKQGQFQLFG